MVVLANDSATNVRPSTRQNFSSSSVSKRLHWGQRFTLGVLSRHVGNAAFCSTLSVSGDLRDAESGVKPPHSKATGLSPRVFQDRPILYNVEGNRTMTANWIYRTPPPYHLHRYKARWSTVQSSCWG